MSSELQSLKYLPAEFLQPEIQPQTPEHSIEEQSPYAPPVSSAEQINVPLEEGRWTNVMTHIASFLSVAGAIGIINGLWSLWGLFNLEAHIESVTELSRRMPELKDSLAMLKAQMAHWNFFMINIVTGLIVSVGFIFSAYMYKNRKENGHMLMAAFCGFAVLFLLMATYLTYVSLAENPTFQGENGRAALRIAMGTVGFIVAIKIGVYVAIAAHMFNRNSKAVFAPEASA